MIVCEIRSTRQKMKFAAHCSNLLKTSLMENFIFCAMIPHRNSSKKHWVASNFTKINSFKQNISGFFSFFFILTTQLSGTLSNENELLK